MHSIESDASNSSSIVVSVFVAMETCLLSHCLAVIRGGYTHRHRASWSHKPTFIQSTYSERPIPPVIKEETPLPSSNGGGGQTQERDHVNLL
jgi:hypothetical protein